MIAQAQRCGSGGRQASACAAQGRREVDEAAQFEAVEANRLLVAGARTKTNRLQAQRRAAARKETAGAAAVASYGTGSGPDYSKPPKLYDVEEWS